jgi:CBS domain-containing protein
MMFVGMEPMFNMSNLMQPTGTALASYIVLGGLMGLAAAVVTRLVYLIEDGFERLPVHWMWWPAIGAIAVGVMGYLSPDTLGVGYRNIDGVLSNSMAASAMLTLAVAKFISWSISLGSGTSGGTMAPLFTIGGALGGAMGIALAEMAPALGVDERIAALVGMAAMFAGASRAMLACAVFAFETTLQPVGLLPLLGGCAAAYLTSSLLMRNSLMTEKIERRGIRAPAEYMADVLDQVLIRDVASKPVVSLRAEDAVSKVRAWLASGAGGTSHQGFPVLNDKGVLIGVLTRKDVLDPVVTDEQPLASVIKRSPKFVYDDLTVRQAAHHMVNHQIGRLPVVRRGPKPQVVGMVTRSDILSVFQRHVEETERQQPTIGWGSKVARRRGSVKA